MGKIELTENETKELKRLMAQGLSKGEALIKMGKAVRVVQEVKELPKKEKAKREVKIDPVKDWIMGFVDVALRGCVDNDALENNVSCVLRDGTKKIDLTINGESYTLALTKHKTTKK